MDLSCHRSARNQNFPATCRRRRQSCGSTRQEPDRPSIGKPASHPSPFTTAIFFHRRNVSPHLYIWHTVAPHRFANRFLIQPVLRVRDLILLEGRRRCSKTRQFLDEKESKYNVGHERTTSPTNCSRTDCGSSMFTSTKCPITRRYFFFNIKSLGSGASQSLGQ